MPQPVNQLAVNEAAHLIARFDTLLEDMQRAVSLAVMECDGTVARIAGRPTVKCEKCRVEVDVTKINMPGRCMDRGCPLKQEHGKKD